jgi:hypothetical protein
LKLLLKRGALLAAANWPAVAIQFVAETTFQALLAVPIVGAAILVAVLIGEDLGDLLQGSARDIATRIATALAADPTALVSFGVAFSIALAAGSALMFLVKGGTLDVLMAAISNGSRSPSMRLHARRRSRCRGSSADALGCFDRTWCSASP